MQESPGHSGQGNWNGRLLPQQYPWLLCLHDRSRRKRRTPYRRIETAETIRQYNCSVHFRSWNMHGSPPLRRKRHLLRRVHESSHDYFMASTNQATGRQPYHDCVRRYVSHLIIHDGILQRHSAGSTDIRLCQLYPVRKSGQENRAALLSRTTR